jgi:hypothetical protein
MAKLRNSSTPHAAAVTVTTSVGTKTIGVSSTNIILLAVHNHVLMHLHDAACHTLPVLWLQPEGGLWKQHKKHPCKQQLKISWSLNTGQPRLQITEQIW